MRLVQCAKIPDKASPFRNLITRMFPPAEEALKTLTNFRSPVMAGLDPAIQYDLKYLEFFWMAGSEPGHDDGIGGNIRVIKFRDDKQR